MNMIVLKLKGRLSALRLKTLVDFLKSWNIEVEVVQPNKDESQPQPTEFTLHSGLWKDRDIDQEKLRNSAWNRA